MVRKWSYITPLNTSVSSYSASPKYLMRRHLIKVFRSGTRFLKRYVNFQTRFTRLSYRRRKHRTSWLSFSHITSTWVRNFLKYRQYLRFYQSLGSVKFQSYSTTANLVNKVVSKGTLPYAASTFSCSRKLLYSFESFNIGLKNTFLPPITGVIFTGLLSANLDQLQGNEELNAGLVECEEFRYPFSTDPKYFDKSLQLLTYSNINNSLTNVALNYSLIVYTISTLLLLNCLFKKN